eukprot:TRINITY_DN1278_c0_g1_i10.p1 TRINITY_DN1278_c0_g1~~TRINITY_DN1278_c0_g1_i10.p1  ORF type:complete len:268 (+),score=88.65 TRINITY_DN1278_c0_g1_i10:119-922(+)
MSGEKAVLVLGGTGTVGSAVCKEALRRGYRVVSMTRRGAPGPESPAHGLDGVDWREGDAASARQTLMLVREVRPAAIVHCIGVLFDCDSWFASLNPVMSGCGSVPDAKKGTYERVIKETAMSAFHAVAFLNEKELPFVFISAAEAGWGRGEMGPLARIAGWLTPLFPSLNTYLHTKLAVEDAMLRGIGVPDICRRRSYAARSIVFRPTMVVPDAAPASCLASCVTYSPVNDRPVTAAQLAAAVLAGVEDEACRGVYRRRAILEMGKR